MAFSTRTWPANGGTAGSVSQHFGVRTTNGKFGGVVDNDLIKVAEWTFTATGAGKAVDLPQGSTGKMNLVIPAYSKILRATFEVITGFTSTSTTTDLDIGLVSAVDGTTAIDADGLFTASALTQTAIATRGNFYIGAGALVNASTGAVAGQLYITPTADDLLTGKARITVEYITEGV